jgi:hypothetical protein
MANVLTDLAADIYKAADIVGRELTGAASSVLINADGSERVALGDTVRSHFTRQATLVDVTPSMTIPQGTDQTVDNKTLSITKAKAVQIPWTGEDIRSVNNGSGFESIYGDQIRQAMRKLTNEIEADLLTDIYQNSSRAVGTAGTTPFASNINLVAQARQILVDNGTPMDGMSTMVLNTLAGTNLRNLSQLQKVNESGGSEMLRRGVLLELQDLMLKESAGVRSHTKGTGADFEINAAEGLPVGTTTIPVDTGTGTILAGDVVTFDSDEDNQYVVVGALSGGEFTIASPGLRVALPDDDDVTVAANHTANVAFHRNAVELVMRAPEVPLGGDAADDAMTIQDPFSGLVYEIRSYKGYRKAMFEVAATWGYKTWKPDFVATILG